MSPDAPMSTEVPITVVLVSPTDLAPAVLEGWESAVSSGAVHVVHGAHALRYLLGTLDADAAVVVAEAGTTPGPALVERLLGARGMADVIDTRVLPVDLARGPEADMEAETAAVSAGRVGPRLSGVCVLTRVGVAASLVGVLGVPRDAATAQAFAEALESKGHTVAVEVLATVVRHADIEAEGHAGGIAEGDAPATWAAPATTHPALLEATTLHHLLAPTGLVGEVTGHPEDAGAGDPFLTVLTRTQGRRRHCLEDVLACLSAQEDRDFEWLVACHRTDATQLASVREVLALAPPWLRDRTRLVEVDRTGRSSPLNDGFAAARGRYVAVLDDDETVAASWVSTFHRLEGEYAGRVLRAAAVRQSVAPHAVDHEVLGLSVGNPRRDWPVQFDLLDHLRHNETPPLAVAFPRGVFHVLGIRFDESLDVNEDWDFLVRAAGHVGVAGSPLATSAYHWWLDGESSRSLHDEQEWEAARQRVLAGFADSFFLLAGDGARRLQGELAAAEQRIVELETSQNDVILQLDRTANEHQKTVDNWRATEARVAELKERLSSTRARFRSRLELIEQVEARLRETGADRPGESIYEMSPKELKVLLAGKSPAPGGRGRFGRRSG